MLIKVCFKTLTKRNDEDARMSYRKMQIFIANILKFLKYFPLIIYGVIYKKS